jgi:hypothetical protein
MIQCHYLNDSMIEVEIPEYNKKPLDLRILLHGPTLWIPLKPLIDLVKAPIVYLPFFSSLIEPINTI